jgi:hypothetical protein
MADIQRGYSTGAGGGGGYYGHPHDVADGGGGVSDVFAPDPEHYAKALEVVEAARWAATFPQAWTVEKVERLRAALAAFDGVQPPKTGSPGPVRMVRGRRVADWVSVSALLAGVADPWIGVRVAPPFTVMVDDTPARPGDVVVLELDGTLTVEKYDDVAP